LVNKNCRDATYLLRGGLTSYSGFAILLGTRVLYYITVGSFRGVKDFVLGECLVVVVL